MPKLDSFALYTWDWKVSIPDLDNTVTGSRTERLTIFEILVLTNALKYYTNINTANYICYP
eukprot:4443525-Ditylum_brightwellii.AAC.1